MINIYKHDDLPIQGGDFQGKDGRFNHDTGYFFTGENGDTTVRCLRDMSPTKAIWVSEKVGYPPTRFLFFFRKCMDHLFDALCHGDIISYCCSFWTLYIYIHNLLAIDDGCNDLVSCSLHHDDGNERGSSPKRASI
jgi:hypothetical protein